MLQELTINWAKLEALFIDNVVRSICINLIDNIRSLPFRSEFAPRSYGFWWSVFLGPTLDRLLETTMVELSCWMLRQSEPGSIPTFLVPEVVFHWRPPILQIEVSCFPPHGTLLTWQCVMTGFEFLKARQLLLHKLEHKEFTVLASYMSSGTPKGLPLIFHANSNWIWKPPSSTGCTMSCWMFLLDHLQVCYTLMTCARRTWISCRGYSLAC